MPRFDLTGAVCVDRGRVYREDLTFLRRNTRSSHEVLLNRRLVECDVVEEATVRLLRDAVRIGGAMTELPGFETGKFRPVRHEPVLRDRFDL